MRLMTLGSLFAFVFGPVGNAVTHGTADAQTARIHDLSAVQGFSQPARTSVVATQTSGVIASLEVKAGTTVRKGDALARLDDTVHLKRLEHARQTKDAKAEKLLAQVKLDAKKTRLNRLESLFSRDHATPTELQQARQDFEQAEAMVLRAEEAALVAAAEYERLLAEAKQFTIVAPFDGVVIEFKKQVGEYVGPVDAAVCVVVELRELSVDFLVPKTLRSSLKLNRTVRVFFIDSDQRVSGTVYYISPFPHGETGTFTVKVRVKNHEGNLNAGQRCVLEATSTKDWMDAAALQRSNRRGSSEAG